MPTESIVFAPEVDERQLGRETDAVNEQLQEVGQDIPVEFQGDMGGIQDGLEIPGGDAGGGVPGGAGAAASAAGLASKIPKPVTGVATAAALPVALSGAVGVGMFSAMESASARLQTQTSLIGQAWKTFWRPFGDKTAEFLSPITTELVNLSTKFEAEAQSEGLPFAIGAGALRGFTSLGEGLQRFVEGRTRQQFSSPMNMLQGLAGPVGQVAPGLARGGAKALSERFQSPADIASASGGLLGLLATGLARGGASGLKQSLGLNEPLVNTSEVTNEFTSTIEKAWPGWPEVDAEWPGWPNVPRLWPGWPDIGGLWPGWPSLNVNDVLNTTFNVGVTANDIIDSIGWPSINTDDLIPELGGGGGGNGGFLSNLGSGFQRGGVVQTSGAARVHSGEMIGDERQLVEELSNAIDGNGGSGGGGNIDTTALENKLDRLHRDLKQLQSAFDVTLETDDETLARSTNNGRRNRLGDTDPTL